MFRQKKHMTLLAFLCIFTCCFAYGIDNPNFNKQKVFTIKSDKELTEIAKILHSISSLKGIKYYSNTNEAWQTLYHEAGFIANPDSEDILPDSYFSGPNKPYYCFLEDNSLGDCIFKITYLENPNTLNANFIIVKPITFMGITCISPNNLVIQLNVKKTGGTLLFTIQIDAKYQTISFLESKLEKSLNARLDALYKWFEDELKKL